MLTIIFCMLCEDFSFHFIHKLLHHPRIYSLIHKIHHSHIVTISIAVEYAHPIEFILGNLIPTTLGPLLLGRNLHIFTFAIWGKVRLTETLEDHSGYEFPWSPFRLIPFSASAAYHDFHHSHNVGNYSSFFSFWDTLCGTNKDYYNYYE
jgi:sterol desaturase/sphingolipid hydroxylase (fatty acid hydroxylase superfamily)